MPPVAPAPAVDVPAAAPAPSTEAGVADLEVQAGVVLSINLDLWSTQLDTQRAALAQIDRDLTQALADHATHPTPQGQARVQQLMQQAQQLRQDLVAHGVSLPALDLPALAQVPMATTGAPPAVSGQAASASTAARGRAPVPVPAPAPPAALSPDAAPVPSSGAAPGPASGRAPSPVAAPPNVPEPTAQGASPPLPVARVMASPSAQPRPAVVDLPQGGAGAASVAAPAVALNPSALLAPADRSSLSELERQRAVAAARGSLDEASTRQPTRARRQPGQQHPTRDDHQLSARELAQLEHLWDCCRVALAAWKARPADATRAAVRQAFDDLDRYGRWLASQGKFVPPAPADLDPALA